MNLGQRRFSLSVGPRMTHPMWMWYAARRLNLSGQKIKLVDELQLDFKK